MEFLKELFEFLKFKKKLVLAPLILLLIAIGGTLIFAQNSIFAPFIYTLF